MLDSILGLSHCLPPALRYTNTIQTILLSFCQDHIPKTAIQHSGNSSGARKALFGILAPELTISAALKKSLNISEHLILSCVK